MNRSVRPENGTDRIWPTFYFTHSKTFFRNQKVFGDFKRIVSHIDPDGDQVAVTKKYSSKKIPQPEDIQVEVPNVDFDEHSGTFSNNFLLYFKILSELCSTAPRFEIVKSWITDAYAGP